MEAHVTHCVSYSKVLMQNWIGVSWVRYAVPGGTFNSYSLRKQLAYEGKSREEDVAVGEMRDTTGGLISGM